MDIEKVLFSITLIQNTLICRHVTIKVFVVFVFICIYPKYAQILLKQ